MKNKNSNLIQTCKNQFKFLKMSVLFVAVFTILSLVSSCDKGDYTVEKEYNEALLLADSTEVDSINGGNLKAGQHNYVFLKWTNNGHADSQKKHIRRYQEVCSSHYWEGPFDRNADVSYDFIWFNHRQKDANSHYEDRTYKCPLDSHQMNETRTESHSFTHPTYPNYCVDCGYNR